MSNSKKLLSVLALALLASGVVKYQNYDNSPRLSSEDFFEVTHANDEFDGYQKGVKLNGPKKAVEAAENQVSDVKVQITDVDENGKRSIRYIAAISSLDVQATFTRTIYNEDGSVWQAEKEMKVEYAYESVVADGVEILPSEFGEGYNYFIAYTVGNVPESHWFHKIDVKVSVNEDTATRAANIEGLMELDSQLKYSTVSKSYMPGTDFKVNALLAAGGYTNTNVYEVGIASTSKTTATEVNISKWYKTYEDLVATRVGPVIQVKYSGFNGCSNLKTVNFPDSDYFYGIKYNAFQSTAIEDFTIPESIEMLEYSLFKYSSIKNLYLKADNVVKSVSSTRMVLEDDVENLYVSKNVKSIPAYFINKSGSSTYKVTNIFYDDVAANWESVVKTNNDWIENAVKIFTDTPKHVGTFNFNGGTLVVDGKEYNDKYEVEEYQGLKLTDPGVPTMDGFVFNGWFKDSNYEEPVTAFDPLEADVDYYAYFLPFENGMDKDNPLELTLGENPAKTTCIAMPYVYYSFTPSESDYYYFEDISSSSSYGSAIWIYDSSDTQVGYYSSGSNNFALYQELTAGEEYLIKVGYTTTYNYKYFEIQIKVSRFDNDYPSEAKVISYNTEVSGKIVEGSNYFKYTPNEGENVFTINGFTVGTSYNVTVIIKEENSDTELYNVSYNQNYLKAYHFALEVEKTYLIEVTSVYSGDFNFKLEPAVAGATKERPIEYKLNEEVTVDFTKGARTKYNSSYHFTSVFYSFTPEVDVTGTFEFTATNSTYAQVKISEGTNVIYEPKTGTSTISSASEEFAFEAGKTYIIEFRERTGSSAVLKMSLTFSITGTVVEEEEEQPPIDESIPGNSINNPLLISPILNSRYNLEFEVGTKKYVYFTTSSTFNYIYFGSNVTAKLYSATVTVEDEVTTVVPGSELASINNTEEMSYYSYGTKSYILEIDSSAATNSVMLYYYESYDEWYY